jgi:NAD(P) transhydrogenase beta subunit
MDEVNPAFESADVALVVGPRDVVNPAAKMTPDAPTYGMPTLAVGDAQQAVFLKRSIRLGFAGIENVPFYDPKTMPVFGDETDSLTKVVSGVRNLTGSLPSGDRARDPEAVDHASPSGHRRLRGVSTGLARCRPRGCRNRAGTSLGATNRRRPANQPAGYECPSSPLLCPARSGKR